MTAAIQTLRWDGTNLILLDQTALPSSVSYLTCSTWESVSDAIRRLAVRGAPAIGVAAAYGLVLAAAQLNRENLSTDEYRKRFESACMQMNASRPTAVNLSWAVEKIRSLFLREGPGPGLRDRLLEEAVRIEEEDRQITEKIADCGATLFRDRKELVLMTHCNAGALATAGIGTALGVIRRLHENGQVSQVYMDETRPLLQGSRLTASELMQEKIPCCLICDDMAATVMAARKPNAVITGADRIARNGDTANKIGTYGLAVLAAYHHIPFYVAAPFSTFDFSIVSGKEITIEERPGDEIRHIRGVATAPADVPVYNPAFDITPGNLIAGIITERGVLRFPYENSIEQYERRVKNE